MSQIKKPRRIFISLNSRILYGLVILFAIAFVASFYWFYQFSVQNALGQLKQVHKGLLEAVLAEYPVDGFAKMKTYDASTLTLDDLGYPDDPLYKADANWMYQAYLIKRRALLYTFYIEGDQVIYMTTMAGPKGSKNGVKFKDTAEATAEHIKCLDGLYYRNNYQVYKDKFGAWLSACAPIRSSNGDVLGVLGSDYRATYVADLEKGIYDRIALALSVSLLVIVIAILIITSAITRPLTAFKGVVAQVAAGNYDVNLGPIIKRRLSDEITLMAQAFETMVQQVSQREETLKQQVQTLTIAVDEARRKAQVSEIVETDFFRQLQDRSEDMRRRRRLNLASGEGG